MAGRKSKYPTHVQPKLEIIRAWRRRGLTEEQVAERLGVAVSSFSEYKLQYPELAEVLKIGLDEGVAEIENAHYKSAKGYEYEERRVVYDCDDNGKPLPKPSRIEVTKKQVQGNTTAQIFILKNRGGWRDAKDLSFSGKDGEDLVIKVKYVGGDG
jgi:transcriptional regulator with XRE-family HTH domain